MQFLYSWSTYLRTLLRTLFTFVCSFPIELEFGVGCWEGKETGMSDENVSGKKENQQSTRPTSIFIECCNETLFAPKVLTPHRWKNTKAEKSRRLHGKDLLHGHVTFVSQKSR